jgi:FdhD protein
VADPGSYPVTYAGYYDTARRAVGGVVPVEEMITLYVNAQPLVSTMCTPIQLEDLAVGFLFNEGLIETVDDVAVVELCGSGRCVDIWLEHDVEAPQLRVVTSGCSGGTTFEDVAAVRHRVESDRRVTPEVVTRLMQELSRQADLYHRSGGIHTAGVAEGERMVCIAEDIGRHNALDKVAGMCLRQGLATGEVILLTSGRVSSEMLQKVARLGVPIVVSRTSPTSLSVQLAEAWNVTLIGYTRRRSFRVYAGEERVVGGEPASEA